MRNRRLISLIAPACAGLAWPAEAAPQPERWKATSTTAISITGDVRFSPDRITFQNGKSLPLARVGTIPVKDHGGGAVQATLYRVTKLSNPILLMSNTLCGRDPVTHLAVWPIPGGGHGLTMFLGPAAPKNGESESCAQFNYESP